MESADLQSKVILGESDPTDVLGRANALTNFNTVKPYGVPILRALFFIATHVPLFSAKLRKLSFIHFARWTLVDRLPGESLRHTHLFFESNFNGTWSQYIDAFSYVVPRELGLIWHWCFAFPGPIPAEDFKLQIARHDYAASHYYSAFPHASTTMVLGALEVKARLDRLRRDARKMDAAEFDAAWQTFLKETQPHL